MATSVLESAKREEQEYREAISDALKQATTLVESQITDINMSRSEVKKMAIAELDLNLELAHNLNNYIKSIKQHATYSLKTNKLVETFTCSKQILEDQWDHTANKSLMELYSLNPDSKTILGNKNSDYGTSVPHCMFNALFTISYKLAECITVQCTDPIFHIDKPTAHTTKLPNNFDDTKLSSECHDWIYFYKDKLSPPKGELYFTTVGYAFGGSREDSRYDDKLLKPEDCSSSIAKWLGANKPFSTIHMKWFYDNNCKKDDSYCNAVGETLIPKNQNNLEGVNAGDIFVFRTGSGGHTGVISKILGDNCFEHLSYNRDMPHMEGLGYRENCLDEAGKTYYFFAEASHVHTEL